MERLIIIGASGQGKVVADIAKLSGYTDIVFLDNDPLMKECAGYPVLGPDTMAAELDGDIFIAVGKGDTRRKLMERDYERNFPVLIHPSAVIADSVVIEEGSVIMAGTIINPYANIGRGCIVNTAASIDHDCVIGAYSHVSVGAHLSGTVFVGEGTWVGAGVTISNNINICSGAIIGAGTVVINDIKEKGTYIGVPARNILRNTAS